MAFFDPNISKLKARRNINGLIKALSSKSIEIQVQAARSLGDLYARDAVDALIVALKDWNYQVQVAAAEALGRIGNTKAIKPLIYTLRDNNELLKKTVISALAAIGYDAVQPLVEILNDSNEKLQDYVIDAISELGDAAKRPIKNFLFDHSYPNRPAMLKVFARIADKDSIDILIEILNSDPVFELRLASAEYLVRMGEKSVPQLLETALHPDSDLILMLNLLSKIGDIRCREFFIENLISMDAKIRLLAANGLEKSGWQPRNDETGVWYYIGKRKWYKLAQLGTIAIGPLGKIIDDKDESIRKAALDTIGQIGEEGSDELMKSLTSKRAEARLHAAAALGKLGEKRAIEGLTHCLVDADTRVRRAAVESLGEIDTKECINPIIMALKDEDAQVRRTAVKFVGESEDPRALDLFINMLNDPAPAVSQELVKAFLRIGKEAVDSLIDALQQPNSIVKKYAATTLGLLKDQRAVAPLLNLTTYSNWVVRKAVVIALGEINDRRAVNALAVNLDDEKDEVALAAAKALASIGKPAVSVLLNLLTGRKKNPYAVIALKEMKIDAITPLINLLKHPDMAVRKTVVKVLDMINWKPGQDEIGAAYFIAKQEWEKSIELGEQAVDPLIEVLTDDELWHRKRAAENLGKLNDNKAVDSLIQSLGDKYWNVREAAMKSLIKMGRKAVEPLLGAMLTGNKDAFESIVNALAEIGDRRAVNPLVYVLKDKRRFVRQAAGKALEKMNALEGDRRCTSCGKTIHKTLDSGDFCPFCNQIIEIKIQADLTHS
ncbi:MAG: HEAT repeat domain-containing protein [Calditrichaeota bacterium]|nr:HEAT repeat domain-containing protein [Calditrichota bacterium]